MKRAGTFLFALSLAITAMGCKKIAADTNNDIRIAIEAHLAQKGTLNLKAFDTVVKHVTLQGDRTQAQVEFHVKNGPGMMQLNYALQKNGDTWTVIESNPGNADFSHPSLDSKQSPAGAGQDASNPIVSDALRNFKMGGNSAPAGLPPGHPPVTTNPPSAPQYSTQ